ncbi:MULTISPECIES: dipeptide ABC transporter ATP-binding protein [Aestuariimicrobium]|uniref:dipeptide ABC transporter ATP-binding protein n=1 Tax=Aestuariimicrobium TaxID=396388 RepID=UPI0003B5695D|nr:MULTISPECIES: ABC transporter ATP-binding protein [Aestuariimicrobium]CAI9407305.1 Glutathione import ATP-binding protein GsiA [Aestuariimicrobium sp. T2.26MG-19.2B]
MDDQSGAPLLRVRDLDISFGSPAVRGASWQLQRGRVTALVGESGSGKSVSAMAVLGLLPGTATVTGSIVFSPDDRPGADSDRTELVGASADTFRAVRGAIFSLVSQEPMGAWNPVLTLGDQVAEAVQAHRGRGHRSPPLDRSDLRSRVHHLFTEAGLRDPARIAGSFPHQLSGGQLQRALIAMALAQDPVAIIADEPTTALDVTVQAEILDVLRRLQAERGTAVLLITHDMGVVADLADDVVVMQQGRVVEHAPVGELFSRPRHPYTVQLLASVPRLEAHHATAAGVSGTAHLSGQTASPADHPPTTDREITEPDLPTVRLEQVGVVHPGRKGAAPVVAADGVDLTISPGEVLGLVGESGSGKSTLAQVIGGLLAPTSGRVLVDGVDLQHATRAQRNGRRRTTGIVFQDPASTLNPRWSVGRSVAEPLRLHTDIDDRARRERVAGLLERVRLDPALAQRFPHELSGGQRQRVAIARAVALRPRLLIADEPTSALDVSVQASVLALLEELQADLGFACLFVSHNLAVVEQVADTVAVMKSGSIVEHGPAARVLQDPRHEYTRALVAAAPVPDPHLQRERREARWAVKA